jgi:hypothetical protein
MTTNEQMIRNRYGRWAKARKLYASIQEILKAGGCVTVSSCTKVWVYDARHINDFKCTKTGVLVRHGKRYDCIDYCGIGLHGNGF